LSLTTTKGPPPFLDPIFFLDHVVAPYSNGFSFFASPIIIIFLDPNASSFASPHVQTFKTMSQYPMLICLILFLTWNLIHLAKNKSFFEVKTKKMNLIIVFGSCKLNGQQKCHGQKV
jgi:hypothetical protein